ncbi:MAG: 23S rRNA (pseudouridine(1915)-N(3))-methyltransferase RlmH [Calditrichaeota bacterium]|nr:23S rRNA (pseudouridine(1915)-N(3))-methyltransferase RlmH [Calditrichota bacterium]
MRVKLLVVGVPKNTHVRALAKDYLQRLARYANVDATYVKEERRSDPPSTRTPTRQERRLLERLTGRDFVVVLDAAGRMMTSPELAQFLAARANSPASATVFIIGGPEGLGPHLKERADLMLSLSPMTFPHELCLVVVLEQLYRAFTILKGEPYHK